VTFESDPIDPLAPNGFVLAATTHFLVSFNVPFPGQKTQARATEVLAQAGEKLAFVEPGSPANGGLLSLNL